MEEFIPAKIYDKKYADLLLSGEVFMRPLHYFGSWNAHKDETLNNNFRGDQTEGTGELYASAKEDPFFEGLDPQFTQAVQRVRHIDEGDSQYFKIYSLYKMLYDPRTDFFQKPDPRMKQFGDTAVIITDFGAFLSRCLEALLDQYPNFCFLMDEIRFYDDTKTQKMPPLFYNGESYTYQHELRIALGILEENKFARAQDGKFSMRLVWELESLKLQIGDIRDIAFSVPIEDFLNLRFPEEVPLRFPMGDEGHVTLYDRIVADTREQMKQYKMTHYSKYVTIG